MLFRKISKLLQLIVLVFMVFYLCTGCDSFNIKVDLNIEKAIIMSKTKSEDLNFYKTFAKKDKNDCLKKVDQLILFIISSFIFFNGVQKKMKVEKKQSQQLKN